MDKAIIGEQARIGYFRVGVYRADWDKLVKRFENVSGGGGLDAAIVGEQCRCGYSRCGVYVNLWDQLVKRCEAVS